MKSKIVVINESETEHTKKGGFADCINFQGLYKVRERLYKVVIRSEPSMSGSSTFCSYCSNVDAGVTLWDNKAVQIHTTDGTKLEETRAILGEELSVYMDMFNKMS